MWCTPQTSRASLRLRFPSLVSGGPLAEGPSAKRPPRAPPPLILATFARELACHFSSAFLVLLRVLFSLSLSFSFSLFPLAIHARLSLFSRSPIFILFPHFPLFVFDVNRPFFFLYSSLRSLLDYLESASYFLSLIFFPSHPLVCCGPVATPCDRKRFPALRLSRCHSRGAARKRMIFLSFAMDLPLVLASTLCNVIIRCTDHRAFNWELKFDSKFRSNLQSDKHINYVHIQPFALFIINYRI